MIIAPPRPAPFFGRSGQFHSQMPDYSIATKIGTNWSDAIGGAVGAITSGIKEGKLRKKKADTLRGAAKLFAEELGYTKEEMEEISSTMSAEDLQNIIFTGQTKQKIGEDKSKRTWYGLQQDKLQAGLDEDSRQLAAALSFQKDIKNEMEITGEIHADFISDFENETDPDKQKSLSDNYFKRLTPKRREDLRVFMEYGDDKVPPTEAEVKAFVEASTPWEVVEIGGQEFLKKGDVMTPFPRSGALSRTAEQIKAQRQQDAYRAGHYDAYVDSVRGSKQVEDSEGNIINSALAALEDNAHAAGIFARRATSGPLRTDFHQWVGDYTLGAKLDERDVEQFDEDKDGKLNGAEERKAKEVRRIQARQAIQYFAHEVLFKDIEPDSTERIDQEFDSSGNPILQSGFTRAEWFRAMNMPDPMVDVVGSPDRKFLPDEEDYTGLIPYMNRKYPLTHKHIMKIRSIPANP